MPLLGLNIYSSNENSERRKGISPKGKPNFNGTMPSTRTRGLLESTVAQNRLHQGQEFPYSTFRLSPNHKTTCSQWTDPRTRRYWQCCWPTTVASFSSNLKRPSSERATTKDRLHKVTPSNMHGTSPWFPCTIATKICFALNPRLTFAKPCLNALRTVFLPYITAK